jgi:16S rRNA (adenine1518-N6/adenine1519-N6)-dimethyltransferase
MAEIIDIVDQNDKVIGTAPRKGIHNTDQLHRASHIFLINSEGQIWLELRAMHCDNYPGHYSSSAAGHISSGEDYLTGALREAEEELGIEGLKLQFKHKFTPTAESMNEFISFYTAKSDEVPKPCEDTERFDLLYPDEITAMIESKNSKVSKSFIRIFEWYKSNT